MCIYICILIPNTCCLNVTFYEINKNSVGYIFLKIYISYFHFYLPFSWLK